MNVIYGLIPGMLLLGLVGIVAFIWAVRSGQYDDMERGANTALMDDLEQEVSPSQADKDINAVDYIAKK